jgi:regulator of protease activity HflC (stomatin/prohibitin superfamily)
MLLSEAIPLNTSARWRAALLVIGATLTVIGFVSWMVTPRDLVAGRGDGVSLPSVAGYLAASLFVAATGMVSAALVAHGRLYASIVAKRVAEFEEWEASGKPDARGWVLPAPDTWTPEILAGWPQVLVSILMGGLALAAVINCWSLGNQPVASLQTQQVYGGLLVLLAFPFLVLERVYANTPPRALPDARQLERLSRVPLACFVGLGITRVLLSVGFEWATIIERAIAVVIGLVSLELVLRGLAMIFVPFAPINSRRSTADSTIAGLLRLTAPSFTSVGTAVKRQFGIDLSRSWALAFVRRAALPVGFGLALFAWCLTGVTALGLNERAVYERLGLPISVFGPGIHVHLPWPFGIVRSVELGVLHDVPVVLAPPGEQSDVTGATGQMADEAGIEGLAPVSADRLWDETHPSEASYLIASEARGQQSFQIVNVDLRIVYRIGLSDVAARNAVYSVAEPEALTRALAGRLLARYFAHYTLLDVLGQSRERFANDFRDELQEQLRELATGIEVIAVVVEAIHPPAGAAAAYHNVQAAEILAQSQIALRRADAITAIKYAEQNATTIRASAAAAAAERVNQARGADAMFEGDRQAWLHDGEVFLFERWLDRLGGSLARSSFILLDHRLKGAAAPTIDLRSLAPPGMPGPVEPPQTTPPDQEPGDGPNQTSPPASNIDPDAR